MVAASKQYNTNLCSSSARRTMEVGERARRVEGGRINAETVSINSTVPISRDFTQTVCACVAREYFFCGVYCQGFS